MTSTNMRKIAKAFRNHGRWLVNLTSGNSFVAHKVTNKKTMKVIEARLIKTKDGYVIHIPDYSYVNRNSIYAARVENERRVCRAKNVNESLIFALKECGLWNVVVNPDYLIANPYNKKINRKYINDRLRKIIKQ